MFAISSGVTATITGQTISNGSASYGGGIDNAGTLTVTSSTIDNNSAGYRWRPLQCGHAVRHQFHHRQQLGRLRWRYRQRGHAVRHQLARSPITQPMGAPAPSPLMSQAYIDGRDELIIQGNTLQWDHFDFAAPGRLGGVNYPTIITTTLNGVTQMNGVDWIPTWPDPPPDPIRFPAMSSVFTGLTPTIPDTTDVTLTVITARDSMTIAQLPSASNGFTTLLEFNDDPSGRRGLV